MTDLEVTYTLSPAYTIAGVSGGWDDFARDNGAAELAGEAILGTSIWSWVGGPDTRLLLRKLLDRARDGTALRGIGYRCDSPELRRYMELDAKLNFDGILQLTHRLVRVEERETPAELLARSARRASDLIRMCSWCNSIHIEPAGWLEIEEAARISPLLSRARQPSITHGVCPGCMDALTGMADGPEPEPLTTRSSSPDPSTSRPFGLRDPSA